MPIFRWLAPTIAWCAVATLVHAEPLTFARALDLASGTAPGIEAASLQIDAARSSAKAAGALPDPKLSVKANDFPISGPLAGRPDLDNFSMLQIGISQDVPNGPKRRARVEDVKAQITQAQADLLLQRRKVRVATAAAWIDLYFARLRLAALNDLEQKLNAEVGTAPAQLTSGDIHPSASLAPRQALAALDDRRAGLVAGIAKARAELSRWLGPLGGLEPAGPPPADVIDAAELRSRLEGLPALRVADAAVERARAGASLAEADKRPDWSYGLEYSRRDPRFGDYISDTVTLSLPIFAATRQDPVIAARL